MQRKKTSHGDQVNNRDMEHVKYEIAQELGLQNRKNKNKNKQKINK